MVRMYYLLPLFISRQEFDNFRLPDTPVIIKSFGKESTEINSFVLMQEILFVCFDNAAQDIRGMVLRTLWNIWRRTSCSQVIRQAWQWTLRRA